MDAIVFVLARVLVAVIQALPLRWMARLGRMLGTLAFRLSGRYRRVAVENLTLCFGQEKSAAEIYELARENFRRLGENYVCAIKTVAMTAEELKPHVEFTGIDRLPPATGGTLPNVIIAIGHFGNFELYARFQDVRRDYQCATTYRGLKQPALDRLMQALRQRSGCLYFERRTDGPLLRAALGRGGLILGLLADQSSRACSGRSWAMIAIQGWPRRCWRCATKPNCTPPFVIAWHPPNGAWTWIKKLPPMKTAIPGPPRTSCAT